MRSALGTSRLPDRAVLAVGILCAAGVAWLIVIRQSAGMTSAPGTMGLGAASFLGLWTAMMAAMMLPALLPLAVVYVGEGYGRVARTTGLIAGYLVVWAAFGVIALAASAAAGRLAAHSDSVAVWAGAAVLVGAGLFQLTPLKGRCLAVCRSPLHILMRVGGYRGPSRHIRAGAYHGAYCVSCCWSLMVALIALGVMDLAWMAAFTVVITLEKLWRHGPLVAVAAGVALIALGVLAPLHPGLVPGLHAPPTPM